MSWSSAGLRAQIKQDMHAPGDSIPFALSEADQLLYEPRAVPLGKKCGCICPGCRQPVYAKHCMSGKRAPHFAHAPGSDCANGFETALHLAAKQLIESRSILAFPELVASIKIFDDMGHLHKPEKQLVAAGRRALTNVVLEQAVGQIRPDVRVNVEDLGAVLVEVAVTHFVDEHKLDQITQAGIPAIEIDLSAFREATFAALEVALFDDPSNTRWLYYPELERAKQGLRDSIQWLLDAATESAASTAAIERARAALVEAERVKRVEEAARRRAEVEKEAARRREEAARNRVLDVEQRILRNEALKKAAAFKARPETHKRQILLRRLGLTQIPSTLAANVRGAMCFGVDDPLIWQATLFGGLVHKQGSQGHGRIARNYARAWMRCRFPIQPEHLDLANDAIDDYLMALTAAGALIARGSAFYAIAVADIASFDILTAVMNDRNFDPTRFRWTPYDQWPGHRQVAVLTEAMIPDVYAAERWIKLASDMHKNIEFPPIEICQCAAGVGTNKEAVAKYLIRLGFLRLAPKEET